MLSSRNPLNRFLLSINLVIANSALHMTDVNYANHRGATESSSLSVIPVEVACPGFVNLFNLVALGYLGPAFEAAITDVNHRYAGTFNFTLTYVTDPVHVRDPVALTEASVDLLAEWYYRRRLFPQTGVSAIITPGEIRKLVIFLNDSFQI